MLQSQCMANNTAVLYCWPQTTQILTDQQIQQFSEMFLGLRNGHKQFHSSVTQLCQAVMLLLKRANLMQRQRRAWFILCQFWSIQSTLAHISALSLSRANITGAIRRLICSPGAALLLA